MPRNLDHARTGRQRSRGFPKRQPRPPRSKRYANRSNRNKTAAPLDAAVFMLNMVLRPAQSYSGLIVVGGISTSCSVVSMRKLLMVVCRSAKNSTSS